MDPTNGSSVFSNEIWGSPGGMRGGAVEEYRGGCASPFEAGRARTIQHVRYLVYDKGQRIDPNIPPGQGGAACWLLVAGCWLLAAG